MFIHTRRRRRRKKEMGGGYKPLMALIGLQLMNAGIALFVRAALVKGMNPLLFVVYRHAIATAVIAPLSYFSSRRNVCRFPLKLTSFAWIFLASLALTANQNLYFKGLYLSSSTVGSATNNLTPATTFVLATIFGMEKIKVGSLRSMAKIIGTFFCVIGAISMAFLKGPQLLNTESVPTKSVINLQRDDNYWLLGCVLLFASSCLYSLWMILQVPISASCPDHLYSSAWTSFLVTLNSATITLVVAKDNTSWNLNSYLELGSCLYAGIVQALAFFIQTWCISERGPLFTVMFNPLSTVIVTIAAAMFLHEETYIGSLIGALAVVIGLYIVLWGKAEDLVEEIKNDMPLELQNDVSSIVQLIVDQSLERENCRDDLEVPLVSHKSHNHVDEYN